jgi:HJR/Mrr/RecB family endonuclease
MFEAKHALTILNRLAQRRPEGEQWLRQALESRLELLGPTAVEVESEIGGPIGRILRELQQETSAENSGLQVVSISQTFTSAELRNEEVRQHLSITSPSIGLLKAIADKKLDLYDLHWRQFEEMVAELLRWEGYKVELGPGSKDGGVDVCATKLLPGIGSIFTVWQAKRLGRGNKVELSTIRELADTREQWKASKGILVTTSFLTRGALDRVARDAHILGKVDNSDLLSWIETYNGRRS